MRIDNPGVLILSELRTFGSILKKFNVNPVLTFYQCEPKEGDKKGLMDLSNLFA